ncbi:hypothetical protein TVAG_411360 [Trichomonas vaginalis G3]|uniref:Uncharacterized protein n=1 Tax=Trichomonas vaginalis (strain ATCC PRA-98 / G3) TaxID=412133 RepID=A2DXP1_TRIV3|nr:protein CBG06246 family [Trichomonas vaginalis G3]EAY14870.1 hypothetical protein TVAG_411360 [Trichomonas vaginalis G3]KAI5541149.1 protein CBG06246 family [Trichomonas vaginalis G3]|eukprot:XP_001327093.1 hypothetical protein [Trichomonas vaginalis G3]
MNEPQDSININSENIENIRKEGLIIDYPSCINQPYSFILMDLIKSCLRDDGEMKQFFENSIYPRFMKKFQEEMLYNGKIEKDFTDSTVKFFLLKIIGNYDQGALNPTEQFSTKTEFFISRMSPKEIRDDCLTVIRTLTDFSFGKQIEDPYGVNPEFLTRVAKWYLWRSPKFLQDQAIEQISEFVEHLRSGVKSFNFDNLQMDFCDNYKVIVNTKKEGEEFGEILTLIQDDKKIVRYFIKGYLGYPAKNGYFDQTALFGPLWVTDDPFPPEYYHYPYLREPFAYKILEFFGMGPHTEFIINPYIGRGFYIATRDLTHENNTFYELEKNIFPNYDFDRCLYHRFNPSVNSIRKIPKSEDLIIIFTKLTKLDIISRIMHLFDLNKRNIGLSLDNCGNAPDINFFLFENIPREIPYIIDFRVAKFTKDYIKSVGHEFLNGRTNIDYGSESTISLALKNKTKQEKFLLGFKAMKGIQEQLASISITETNDECNSIDEIQLKELLKQKSSEFKSLFLQRRDDLPVFRNRTNAELIGYSTRNSSSNEHESNDKHVLSIEDAFDDLDKYCSDIVSCYQTLKNFILKGYHEYYNTDGNLDSIMK